MGSVPASSERSSAATTVEARVSAGGRGRPRPSRRRAASGSRSMARSTSRQITLPDPSHTPLSGLWRKRRGMADSSTYPLPPRHSSASAACCGARLHVQYLTIGVSRRCNSVSCSSPAAASKARASRRAATVAASDSRARSASTLAISGWSTRQRAERRRWAACQVAWATPWRMIGGRAEDAVEPGVVDHLDDGPHASTLLADQLAPRRRPARSRSTRSSGRRACP